MQIQTEITIDRPAHLVWNTVTDIENSADFISGITSIEVIKPGGADKTGFVWKEGRTMMGKEAFEIMTVQNVKPMQSYEVAAESHGTRYLSVIELTIIDDTKTQLSMTFSGQPISLLSKVLAVIMMPFLKGSLKKMIHQDLVDIKTHVEQHPVEESS